MPGDFQFDSVFVVPAVGKDFALYVSLGSLVREEGGVTTEHDPAVVENLHGEFSQPGLRRRSQSVWRGREIRTVNRAGSLIWWPQVKTSF